MYATDKAHRLMQDGRDYMQANRWHAAYKAFSQAADIYRQAGWPTCTHIAEANAALAAGDTDD